MNLTQTHHLNDEEKSQIIRIWNSEYPKTLNYPDSDGFDKYLESLSETNHYILKDNGEIRAWACKFMRDSEKWFAIILDGTIHRKGIGTEMLNAVKNGENNLNGWVIDKEDCIKSDGQMYQSPLYFYLKNGFKTCPETRIDNERLSAVKITWGK